MPARKSALTTASDSLNRWAIRYKFENDPYVSGLQKAIQTKGQIAFWSELRAVEMLPVPEPISGERLRNRMRIYLAFRNIMVFVPIAFTWAAISQATTAFSEYTNKGQSRIVNFFDFWENGYEVLPKFWTLSNVARIDFLLLASIILVSIAISFSERRIENKEESEKAALDRERLQLALDIDSALLDYRKPTPQLVNRQTTQALSNLNQLTRNLQKIAQEQAAQAKKTSKSTGISKEISELRKLIKRISKK